MYMNPFIAIGLLYINPLQEEGQECPSKAFTTGLTFAWLPYSTIGIEFFIISAQQDIPRDTFMWVLFKGVMDWRGNIEKLKY